MRSRRRRRAARHAFTLIELLVVVAIISLLVAILVPQLHGAREVAKQTYCMNNLRHLGVGVSQYADDNRGWLFPNRYWVDPPGVWGGQAIKLHHNDRTRIFPDYVGDKKAFWCPTAERFETDTRTPNYLPVVENMFTSSVLWHMGYWTWIDHDTAGNIPPLTFRGPNDTGRASAVHVDADETILKPWFQCIVANYTYGGVDDPWRGPNGHFSKDGVPGGANALLPDTTVRFIEYEPGIPHTSPLPAFFYQQGSSREIRLNPPLGRRP